MEFTMRVNMGNAAFTDNSRESLAQVLKEVLQDVRNVTRCGDQAPVLGVNGNRVGEWVIS